jgi:hypothetical protein
MTRASHPANQLAAMVKILTLRMSETLRESAVNLFVATEFLFQDRARDSLEPSGMTALAFAGPLRRRAIPALLSDWLSMSRRRPARQAEHDSFLGVRTVTVGVGRPCRASERRSAIRYMIGAASSELPIR